MLKGIAAYRSGDWRACVGWMTTCKQTLDSPIPRSRHCAEVMTDLYILMARVQMENEGEVHHTWRAQETLERARQTLHAEFPRPGKYTGSGVEVWLWAHAVLREAEAMVKSGHAEPTTCP